MGVRGIDVSRGEDVGGHLGSVVRLWFEGRLCCDACGVRGVCDCEVRLHVLRGLESFECL